jgi:transposase
MPKRLRLRRFRRGELQRLKAKMHDRKLPVWVAHRYQLIALMRAGLSTLAAGRRIGCAKETAYRCLADFNRFGFRRFERSSNPVGRPSGLQRHQVQRLVRIARKRPTDVGLPFTNWSMTKLHSYLVKHKLFPAVSPEWLRRLLHRQGISWQRTKTWKHSDDPEFAAKKSGFWRSTPVVPNEAPSSATTNWVPWNSVRWPACAGRVVANPSATGRLIRASRARSNCTDSTMSMPTAWSGECASAKPRETSWPVSPNSGRAIRGNCVSLSSWTTCRPTSGRPTISFPATTWRPSTCPPTRRGSTPSSRSSLPCMPRPSRIQMIPTIPFGGDACIDIFAGATASMAPPIAIWRGLCVRSLERH